MFYATRREFQLFAIVTQKLIATVFQLISTQVFEIIASNPAQQLVINPSCCSAGAKRAKKEYHFFYIQCSDKSSFVLTNLQKNYNMEQDEQPQIALDKNLVFKEYSSLELSTRDKFINQIRLLGYDKPDIVWVASQKIHGSNFSIHSNGESVRYGRRTDFLTKDIPVPCQNPGQFFNESFFDAKNLVTKFHNKLNNVFNKIKEFDPKTLKFSIYGEYFGGNWPVNHPNAVKNGPKQVQKGISYTPHHEFFAFDIFVTTSETAYWVDVFDIPQLLEDNIRAVPVYTKGNFDQVFNVNIVIDSTVPELLELPRLQKNLIEGMVIRPNRNLSLKNGQRAIIKKKNADFLEIVSAPNEKKKEKKQQVIDAEIAPFYEQLVKYVNVNRIDSVVSKFPDLKDRNKLKDLVIKDILTDAEKDEVKLPENEEKHKKLLKEFNSVVLKEINSYFVKH